MRMEPPKMETMFVISWLCSELPGASGLVILGSECPLSGLVASPAPSSSVACDSTS